MKQRAILILIGAILCFYAGMAIDALEALYGTHAANVERIEHAAGSTKP